MGSITHDHPFLPSDRHEGQAAAFEAVFTGTILPMIRRQPGQIEARIGLPHEDTSPNEFCMVMRWRDLDSIKQFAGEQYHQAMIHPDQAHLLKETFVYHYVASA